MCDDITFSQVCKVTFKALQVITPGYYPWLQAPRYPFYVEHVIVVSFCSCDNLMKLISFLTEVLKQLAD